MIRRRTLLAASAAALAAPAILRAQGVQKLTFYYPIAVGGPLQAIMDGYCKAFEQETGIAVEPVYAGDYSQTLIKALAAIRAGTGPQFAVLLAAEMHSLQDQDILVPIDDIGLDAEGKKWLDGFVHGEQPCRGEDVVGTLPAFDRDLLLQQGSLPGLRSGS
jgi:sn-glycerol 3-phosphate transport system substrate-binding protein